MSNILNYPFNRLCVLFQQPDYTPRMAGVVQTFLSEPCDEHGSYFTPLPCAYVPHKCCKHVVWPVNYRTLHSANHKVLLLLHYVMFNAHLSPSSTRCEYEVVHTSL